MRLTLRLLDRIASALERIVEYTERVEHPMVQLEPNPRRGGAVEAWAKNWRDRHPCDGWGNDRAAWHAIDDMLDDLRLRADLGHGWAGVLDDTEGGAPELIEDEPSDPDDGSFTAMSAAPGVWVVIPGTDVELCFPAREITMFYYRRRPLTINLNLNERMERIRAQMPNMSTALTIPQKIARILGQYPHDGDWMVDALTELFSRELDDTEREVNEIERPELTSALRSVISERFVGGADIKERIVQALLVAVHQAAPEEHDALLHQRSKTLYLRVGRDQYRLVTAIDDDGCPVVGGGRLFAREVRALR